MDVEFLDITEIELNDAVTYNEDIYNGLGLRFIDQIESTRGIII